MLTLKLRHQHNVSFTFLQESMIANCYRGYLQFAYIIDAKESGSKDFPVDVK